MLLLFSSLHRTSGTSKVSSQGGGFHATHSLNTPVPVSEVHGVRNLLNVSPYEIQIKLHDFKKQWDKRNILIPKAENGGKARKHWATARLITCITAPSAQLQFQHLGLMMTSFVLPTPQEAVFFFFSSTSAAKMTFTLDKLYFTAHRFPPKIPMVLSSPTSLDSSIDI